MDVVHKKIFEKLKLLLYNCMKQNEQLPTIKF